MASQAPAGALGEGTPTSQGRAGIRGGSPCVLQFTALTDKVAGNGRGRDLRLGP